MVYVDRLDDDERAYFNRQRGYLEERVAAATGLVPERRVEGTACIERDRWLTDLPFPARSGRKQAALLLCDELARRVAAGEPELDQAELRAWTRRLLERHGESLGRSPDDPGEVDELLGLTRFVPTRAGIMALYEYDDVAFELARGRMLLRGHNTSGKTKARGRRRGRRATREHTARRSRRPPRRARGAALARARRSWALAEERAALDRRLTALRAERDEPPAPAPSRPARGEARPGAPLWVLVDFRAGITPDRRRGIEAALEAQACSMLGSRRRGARSILRRSTPRSSPSRGRTTRTSRRLPTP